MMQWGLYSSQINAMQEACVVHCQIFKQPEVTACRQAAKSRHDAIQLVQLSVPSLGYKSKAE